MKPEQERSDDAEVPAAAADGPEEIGVLIGAGGYEAAICQNHVHGEQVVDRQAEGTCEVPEPSAEGQAADTGGRDDPARCG